MIKMDALRCENIIMRRFPTLRKNSEEGLYAEYAKLDFCGIISAGNIQTKGGLYMALACTLALYYDKLDRIEKINNFMNKNDFLQCSMLDDVKPKEIEKIMKEFLEITA